MKLIIGGAFQGKLTYAAETYEIRDGWIDGRSCGPDELKECAGIHHFHEYVRRMLCGPLTAGQNVRQEAGEPTDMPDCAAGSALDLERRAEDFAETLYRENPDILIVSNELGYGVVPIDKNDRMWREFAGRICTCLAARSEEVVRVVCGIGMRIK